MSFIPKMLVSSTSPPLSDLSMKICGMKIFKNKSTSLRFSLVRIDFLFSSHKHFGAWFKLKIEDFPDNIRKVHQHR